MKQVLDLAGGDADSGVSGGDKINDNFTELYDADVAFDSRVDATEADIASLESEVAGLGGTPQSLRKILEQADHLPIFLHRHVQETPPTPGNFFTIFDSADEDNGGLPGGGDVEGVLTICQWTCSYGNMWKDGRLRIFIDDELLPSIDADAATLLLMANEATENSRAKHQANEHFVTSPGKNTTDGRFTWNTDKCWSGGIKDLPIPFLRRAVVQIYNPTGMSTSGGYGALFSQVHGRYGTLPEPLRSFRLKAIGIPSINAVHYGRTEQITFMDLPGIAGSLVSWHVATRGDAPAGGLELHNGHLERQQWVAIDGEARTVGPDGEIITSYSSSGGEDWAFAGYYFAGQDQITDPCVIVSCSNTTNRDNNFLVDFYRRHDGIFFTNGVASGWSLKEKDGLDFLTGHTGSFYWLYYIDTRTAVVPQAPASASCTLLSSTSLRFNWTPPKSWGSQPATTYTITLSPGGATQTVAANVLQADFTGLTTSTNYTATIKANNSVGPSVTGATASGTPLTPTVPGVPTIGTATAGNASATVAFTPPGSNGGAAIDVYRVTPYIAGVAQTGLAVTGAASPITVPGLTNGTAYTFKVEAHNSVGYSTPSGASNSVTPNSASNALDGDAADLGNTVTLSNGGLTVTNANVYPPSCAKAINPLPASAPDGAYEFITTHTGSIDGSTTQLFVGVAVASLDEDFIDNGSNLPAQAAAAIAVNGGVGSSVHTPTYPPGAGDANAHFSGTGNTIRTRVTISSGGTVRTIAWKINSGSYTSEYAVPAGDLYAMIMLYNCSATINFNTFP